MNVPYNKEGLLYVVVLGVLAGLFSAAVISTSAFAQNGVQTGTENLTATTDQAVYQYGQTIPSKSRI
jgi:hypothetical protein